MAGIPGTKQDGGPFSGKGSESLASKEAEGALEEFTRAIRDNPNNSLVYRQRGVALAKKADFDGAIADFSSAVRIDPTDISALYFRGLCWQRKREFQKALADYDKVLQANPSHLKSLGNRKAVISAIASADGSSASAKLSFLKRLWPDIFSPQDAVAATKVSIAVALFSAFGEFINLLLVGLVGRDILGSVSDADKPAEYVSGVIAIALYCVLAWRLWKLPHRILAAIVILVMVAISSVGKVVLLHSTTSIWVSVFLLAGAVAGTRGAYVLYKRERELSPVPQKQQRESSPAEVPRRNMIGLTTFASGAVIGGLVYGYHFTSVPAVIGQILGGGLSIGGLIWLVARKYPLKTVWWFCAVLILLAILYRVLAFEGTKIADTAPQNRTINTASTTSKVPTEVSDPAICSDKPVLSRAWENSSVGKYFSDVRQYIDRSRGSTAKLRPSTLDEAKKIKLVNGYIDQLEDITFLRHLYFLDTTFDGVFPSKNGSGAGIRCSASVTLDAPNVLADLRVLRVAIATYAQHNDGVLDVALAAVEALSDDEGLISRMTAMAKLPQPRRPFRITFDAYFDANDKPMLPVIRERDAQ